MIRLKLAAVIFVMSAVMAITNKVSSNLTYTLYLNLSLVAKVSSKTKVMRSRLECACLCSRTDCGGFNYQQNNGTCTIYRESSVSNLTRGSASSVFMPRHATFLDSSFNKTTSQTSLSVQLPFPLRPGMVVHVYGKFLPRTEFSIDLTPASLDKLDIDLIFRVKVVSGSPSVILNNCINGRFGTEAEKKFTTFPLVVNSVANVYILIKPDKYIVFTNDVYCCEFRSTWKVTDIKFIYVLNYFIVYEVRII